jgi:Fic family protein
MSAKRSIEKLAPGMRERLHKLVKAAGANGLTCDEAEVVTDMPHQTVSARFNEMAKMGQIVSNEKRATRSGRKACVWVAL